MSTLATFSGRVDILIRESDRKPHWSQAESDRYMAQVATRREHFETVSSHFFTEVVRPRLEVLGSFFTNASMADDGPEGRCACWFGYCERFPATTRVDFAIEHDVSFENVVICYDVWMTPLFFKLNEHDKLNLPFNDVSDAVVAEWVEQRLLEFLESYLRIDRGRDDLDDDVAMDPVCGMRIGRKSAPATQIYSGHPYFFCSHECGAKFAKDPTSYVQVKTM